MMTPELTALRFLRGLILGLALGLWYGFLRPLGRRKRALADLLFLMGAFPVWVYFSFAVCQGDLRIGYLSSLFVGGILFDMTLGRILRPLWRRFWRFAWIILQFPRKIVKKIHFFEKKRLHLGKK